jgi:histidyl-tRNA synthetase
MADERQLVEPRTVKGVFDLLPDEAIVRKAVVATIESVFEKYGFAPLETPAFEHLETLLGTGGEETNKELFRLETPEGEPIALRFDQTVPFARMLAQHPDKLKMPFRRYAIGSVWRGDKPGPGRFRQFTQIDIDVAGSDSVAVDAELVSIIAEIMGKLGAADYAILINNRKLIDALLEGCGITDEACGKHVLRVIDKLDKVGLECVRAELGAGRVDDSGDPIPGVNLDPETIETILAFVGVSGETREETLEHVEAALPKSEAADAAVGEMRELAAYLTALGVSERHAPFRPSLARGLDYYTGPVFEIVLAGASDLGSLGGGGRYDGLVSRFLDREIPCTGIAFGLDRLMAALQHVGAGPQPEPAVEALIVTLGAVSKVDALEVANELREAGIRTEVYFGKKKGMRHQLSHADHYRIPIAVILGEDELAQGVVAIKDLLSGKQEREDIADREAYRKAGKTGQVTVPRAELVQTARQLLER